MEPILSPWPLKHRPNVRFNKQILYTLYKLGVRKQKSLPKSIRPTFQSALAKISLLGFASQDLRACFWPHQFSATIQRPLEEKIL